MSKPLDVASITSFSNMFANCTSFNTPISWDTPRMLYTYLTASEVKEFLILYPLVGKASISQDPNSAVWILSDNEKPSRAFINYFKYLNQTGREITKSTLGDALSKEFDIAQEELAK